MEGDQVKLKNIWIAEIRCTVLKQLIRTCIPSVNLMFTLPATRAFSNVVEGVNSKLACSFSLPFVKNF